MVQLHQQQYPLFTPALFPQFHTWQVHHSIQVKHLCCCHHCHSRASDRVRKKITNYAEIFRNIMRKKVLIMRKTHWIMRKIFGSLRSPKITYFHAAEIELPQKPRVCSQATNCGRFARWHVAHRPLCSLKLASLNSPLV